MLENLFYERREFTFWIIFSWLFQNSDGGQRHMYSTWVVFKNKFLSSKVVGSFVGDAY